MTGNANQLGVHALVFTAGWSEPECRSAVEACAEAGFDLIEIPLLNPRSVDVSMTVQVLREFGRSATCSLGLSLETDISSEDPDAVRRGSALLLDAVAVARDVGATYLGGVIYSAMAKYTRGPTSAGRRNCVDTLRAVAARAAESGITVGLEAVNRYESNLINTGDAACALIDEIGASNVVLHLDSYHMNIEEGDLAAAIRRARHHLGYFHIGESNRGYLGTGTVEFQAIFNTLADIEYDGTITFESFSSAVISPEFAGALAVWRNLWTDGRDLAAHARSFIKGGLDVAQRRTLSPS